MKAWMTKVLELLKASLEPPKHELNELDWKAALSPDKKQLTEHLSAFANLGWTVVSAIEETFGATGTLQSETKGAVVLVSRLRAALKRINQCQPGSCRLETL